jgi:acylphosphatase
MNSDKNRVQRVEVRFLGHVQGVGFRYTTRRFASRWPIVGYVENQADGSVFLVAEGVHSVLQEFLDAIVEQMAPNIRSQEVNWYAPNNQFSDFEIQR